LALGVRTLATELNLAEQMHPVLREFWSVLRIVEEGLNLAKGDFPAK
jgi:hypothetical protein